MIKLGIKTNTTLLSKALWGLLLGLLAVGIALGLFGYFYYQTRFFPQTYLELNSATIALSGLTRAQAESTISQQSLPSHQLELELSLETPTATQTATYSALPVALDVDQTVAQAFAKQHQTNNLTDLITQITTTQKILPRWKIETTSLDTVLNEFAQQVAVAGHDPELTLSGSAIAVDPGQLGLELNIDATRHQIETQLQQPDLPTRLQIKASSNQTHQQLSEESAGKLKTRAQELLKYQLDFANQDYPDVYFSVDQAEFLKWIKIDQGFDLDQIKNFLDQQNQKIARPAQNATLEIDQSGTKPTVKNFVPPQDGLEINVESTAKQTQQHLNNLETQLANDEKPDNPIQLELIFHTTSPAVSLGDTNDLGIKERIGFGDSLYYHSIPNRIHNVSITTERISNTLVAPGEEFSFNKTLGEVSRRTGYRSAYVISNGQTILGDGGGVCQVSTTLFRAVLNAGLKVTLRLPHSYRVSYYELNQKPGMDATVYAGNTDFRFINDTDHYILIHGEAYPDDLYMKIEIYGTSDGRTSEIVNHKTWDYRPAPAPVYYPTTDLPAGKIEQIDWAVAGIKASFTNVIKDKDGNIISQKEYYSNYQPWSAKYLVGQ